MESTNAAFIAGRITQIDYTQPETVFYVQTDEEPTWVNVNAVNFSSVVKMTIADYLLDELEADGIFAEVGLGLRAECTVKGAEVFANELDIIEDGSTLYGLNAITLSGTALVEYLECPYSDTSMDLDMFLDSQSYSVFLRIPTCLIRMAGGLKYNVNYVLHCKAQSIFKFDQNRPTYTPEILVTSLFEAAKV